jgi:hypothetical protein
MGKRDRGFIEWRPQRRSLELLTKIEAIIADYAQALTLRQVFYRLVARFGYPKSEHSKRTGLANDQPYARLGDLVVKARRSRRIAMAAIRDDTSTRFEPITYAGIEDFLTDAKARVEHFRLDRQKGQRRRLVVICEAGGMAPQLYYGVTERYGIPVLPSGGFDSVTEKHSYAEEWSTRDQPTTVLHIGDYDESGETMFDALAEDIGAFTADYGGDVEFVRVAVTPEQMRELALPSVPPNPNDNRGRGITETWQAEALDPNDLARILEDAILARFDLAIYHAVLDEEERRRRELIELLSGLGR